MSYELNMCCSVGLIRIPQNWKCNLEGYVMRIRARSLVISQLWTCGQFTQLWLAACWLDVRERDGEKYFPPKYPIPDTQITNQYLFLKLSQILIRNTELKILCLVFRFIKSLVAYKYVSTSYLFIYYKQQHIFLCDCLIHFHITTCSFSDK